MFLLKKLKNKRIYLIKIIASLTLFYAPIIFLFYEKFNINIFQIGIIFSINSIITITSEIPFGLFADKISYKLSVILGYILSIIAMLFFIFGNSYLSFLIANIFMSIGEAGISGAATVLLMPLLDNEKEIFDIGAVSKGIANIIGGLLIGFLYKLNNRLPFIIVFFLLIINLINYSILKDVKNENEDNEDDKINYINLFKNIKSNFYILLILFMCYIVVPQIMVYFPQYLSNINISPIYIGYIYMIANVFSLLGAYIHKKYLGKISTISKIQKSLISISLLSLIMALSKNIYITAISYLIYRIIMGWFYQQFYIYVNDKSSKEYKATMFSVINVVMELAFIVSDPLITYIILKSNIYATYLLTSIITLIIFVFTFINLKGISPKD